MPDLRPSPGALLRLIHWPRAILKGGAFLILAYYVSQQERAVVSGLPLPEGAGLWLAMFFVSSMAALALSMGSFDDLLSSRLASMLPALEAGLRRGLAVLASALGIAAGLWALSQGLGSLEALALAVFSASVFVLSIWASTWAIRVESPALWPLLAFGLPSIPLLTWILAPALPGRVGTEQPLATIVFGLMLAVALLRLVPLLPPRGLAGEEEGAYEEAADERAAGGREGVRVSLSPPPLPAGAWVQTPVRTGLGFWWLELSGLGFARLSVLVGVSGLLGLAFVGFAISAGQWLLRIPLLVLFRLPPLPAPRGSFPIPVGRRERARIAWAADLLQSWGLVAMWGSLVVLASLAVPDRVSTVSGPHPALVLLALAVCLPLHGAIDAALGAKASSPVLGRSLISKLVVVALALVLVMGWIPPAGVWPLFLAAGVAGPGAAYLLFRRHLARCPLGPELPG